MANINVKFNNKDYLLSCDDGQEESLKKLTVFLDKKYSDAQNIIIENKRLIEKRWKELFKDKYQEYKRLHQELVLSDPASALKKGYSIIRDSSGIILKEKSQIQDNQILSAEFKDGCVKVKKVSIKK